MTLRNRIPTLVLVAIYAVAAVFIARPLCMTPGSAITEMASPTPPPLEVWATIEPAPSATSSASPNAGPSVTPTATVTEAPSATATATVTPSATATATEAPSATATATATASVTPSVTASPSPSPSLTRAPAPGPASAVRVLRTCPIDGDTDLLAPAPVHIVFDQPMDTDPATVQVRFEPELSFGVEWLTPEDLLITTAPREPGIEYRLTVEGVRSELGGTLEQPLTLTFGQGGQGAPIPILMYHRIQSLDDDASEAVKQWTVSPQSLAAQMDLLISLGAHVVSLDEVADYLRSGEPLPARPVALTFDDGYVSAYENAVPILQERGMTATFYVPIAFVGSSAYMDWDELRSLVAAGFSIGGHSYDHTRVDALGEAEAERHLGEAKRILEAETGATITSFAYPYGNYSALTMAQLTAYGYETGLTSNLSVWQRAGGLLTLRRIYVSYDDPVQALADKLPW